MKNVYRTYIDVVNFTKSDGKRLDNDKEEKMKMGNGMDIDEENDL